MDRLIPAAKLIAALLVFTSTAQSQAASCSVSGRVTLSGKPAVNLTVTIVELDETRRSEAYRKQGDGTLKEPLRQRAATDAEGRYRMSNLPAGTYLIRVESNAAALAGAGAATEKTVTLDDGESRDDVNLDFIRGGVITGRVTDSNGKPLIAARIRMSVLREIRVGAETEHHYEMRREGHEEMYQTDDRGIYRIYGLPKGRYIVGSGDSGHINPTLSGLPLVWHPGVREEKKAKQLEIDDGVEIAGVDIRLGEAKKTYEAIGRVADADTGAPIPMAHINCSRTDGQTNGMLNESGSAHSQTDAQGHFRLTGLPNGTYAIRFNPPEQGSPFYAEPMTFVIADGNLAGLELKTKRGATISGAVIFEGELDPATWERMKESLWFDVDQKQGAETGDRSFRQVKLNADGTFRAVGLPPGRAFLRDNHWMASPWQLTRIEYNGGDARDGIEIAAGQTIAGLRIVYAEGNGVLRGIVRVTGGVLPDNVEIEVFALPSGADESKRYSGVRYARTDGRGRFTLEGLLPREYELSVWMIQRLGDRGGKLVYKRRPEQRVAVGNGAEASVTIRIDFSKIDWEGRQ